MVTSGLGRSAIGWGGEADELSARIEQVFLAAQEGHEIASHGNGHFDGGSKWSLAQWRAEFDQLHRFLYQVFSLNSLPAVNQKQSAWFNLLNQNILGYRAPLLETNGNLYQAISQTPDYRYQYDASRVAASDYWPVRSSLGIWNFPLASLLL